MSAKLKGFSLDLKKGKQKLSGFSLDAYTSKDKEKKKAKAYRRLLSELGYATPDTTENTSGSENSEPTLPNNDTGHNKMLSNITVPAVIKHKQSHITAYELAQIICREHRFAVINNNLHLYIDKYRYYKLLQGEEEEKFIRRIIPTQYKNYTNGMTVMEIDKWLKSMEHLAVSTEVSESKLKEYINFRNGILHVESGCRVDDDDSLYFTNYVDADYPFDSECKGKNFRRFIRDVTKGDMEIEMLLQEVIGLVISEIRDLKVAVFFYGMPDTGKSLLIEVLRMIVGESFCSNVGLHQISSEQYAAAELFGKKLNTCAEMGEVDLKRLDIFKSLTGNDQYTVRYIYQRPFSFRNRALFLLGGNNFPNIKAVDVTNAFFERLLIVPFMHSIPKSQQDMMLKEKLLKERSFIVEWGVKGLRRLMDNGFVFTKSSVAQELKNEYMSDQNSFQAFIEGACVLNSSSYLFSYEIEHAYRVFCELNGFVPVNKGDIHRILKNVYKLPYKKQSENGSKRNGYFGISLKPEFKVFMGAEHEAARA